MCPSTKYPCHLSWSQKIHKQKYQCLYLFLALWFLSTLENSLDRNLSSLADEDFFLLSHGFFSERVFQLYLPTFSGLLWVLPLGWVFLLGNYLFLPRSSVCAPCSSMTSFSTNVSSSCFCLRNYQSPYFPLLALWGKICSPDSLLRTKALRWVTLHGHYPAERDRPCEKMMNSLSAAIQDTPIFHTSNFITSTRIHKLYLRPPHQDRPQESSRNCHISKVLNPSFSHQVAVWVLIWKTYSSFAESNKSDECFWTLHECLPMYLWTWV